MAQYDYLIVGAGLFGSVFAWKAKQAGKKCLVIDARPQTGGNVWCDKVEGINVHKYGAHIFHTSDEKIWKFVNSFVPFNSFVNSPVAVYKDRRFNLPFNLNTFSQMWGVQTGEEAKAIIEKQRSEIKGEPRNLEEQAISLVGRDIYEILIKGYTEKQWGRPCNELPSFIIKRLPVRFVRDNNYFSDIYQGIPIGGYNILIDKLLEGIEVRLNTDFFADRQGLSDLADKIVYTGKIDEFFDNCFGLLQYRTVRFENEIIDKPDYQGNAVINYTEREVPWTRIIEHKHFEMFGDDVLKTPRTVISKEFSTEWTPGLEPFYPVNDDRNNALLEKYKELASQQSKVVFGGRLAEYKYYDMAPTVAKALELASNEQLDDAQ